MSTNRVCRRDGGIDSRPVLSRAPAGVSGSPPQPPVAVGWVGPRRHV